MDQLHTPISIVLKYIILPTYNNQYSYKFLGRKSCFDNKYLLLETMVDIIILLTSVA